MNRDPQYSYSLNFEKDGGYWWAESKDLKGCVGQGNTREEAVSELAMNEIEWLDAAKKYGIQIPKRKTQTAVLQIDRRRYGNSKRKTFAADPQEAQTADKNS